MYTAKASLVLVALVAGFCLVQAAGGIKGQQREESQQRLSGIKGPRQQQQQQQQIVQQQQQEYQEPVQQTQQQVAIKGPGQIAPVFSAVRVQPIAPPAPIAVAAPLPAAPAPIVQQQIVQQQEQQVQESEVDPNAAAQDSAPAVIAPAAAAAVSEEEANPRPEPYAFGYGFESGDSATAGSSQREETQDANGKVTGFYTLKGEDGRDRRVDYIADANGFRATISTNEMGTAPKDSADVDWQAQAPSEGQLRNAELAFQAARQRELANPTPFAPIALAPAPAIIPAPAPAIVNLNQQPLASANTQSKASIQSPRQSISAAASKGQQSISQLQEPFEQIRQTELNARARKSRHAPFYLFTI